jgi:hypothetical protein
MACSWPGKASAGVGSRSLWGFMKRMADLPKKA